MLRGFLVQAVFVQAFVIRISIHIRLACPTPWSSGLKVILLARKAWGDRFTLGLPINPKLTCGKVVKM